MERRILVVAPVQRDLQYTDREITSLVNQHDVELIRGTDVTAAELARVVRSETFEIIWFISHGQEEGIILSDGVLPMEMAARYINNCGARLCVLNICYSKMSAELIAKRTGASVICTLQQVDDDAAMYFGEALSDELATNDTDYREAYDRAVPYNNKDYVFIDGNKPSTRSLKLSEDVELIIQVRDNTRRIDALEEKITFRFDVRPHQALPGWAVLLLASGGLTALVVIGMFLYQIARAGV